MDRVVIGTAAVEDPGMVERLCREMGSDRVVVAVDARDGQVAIKGWTEGTSVRATALVEQMSGLGVQRFLYTDISRDGTLTQPNFQAMEELSRYHRPPHPGLGGHSLHRTYRKSGLYWRGGSHPWPGPLHRRRGVEGRHQGGRVSNKQVRSGQELPMHLQATYEDENGGWGPNSPFPLDGGKLEPAPVSGTGQALNLIQGWG